MSIIRKVFIILLGVTLMFMNISGVKAQDDNTTTDFSNYITAASLDDKEGDKEIAYTTDTKLTKDTSLVFKLDADVPSSALSSDHKIDYQLPDNLNVDDTTSDHIYLKDDLTKSVGNYTIADHHMVIDLSTLDYGVDSSKSIELDLETTTSHLIFTDSEAKIYFRKATNESPTEVMVSVLQSYTNDTKADPNSIIKNTNTYTNTKKSSKQVITMFGVKRANSSVKARAGVIHEISDTINDKARDGGLSGEYRLTGTTRLDQRMSNKYNAGVLINKTVTIDLNGHKLQLYDGLYFDIQSGGHLTILDSASKNYTPHQPHQPHPQPKENTSNDGEKTSNEKTSNAGNLSVLTKNTQNDPDKREVPVKLDYYVTHAEANGVTTTDTTAKYEVDLSHAGRIYTETSSDGGKDSTFMIEKGGTLDFESGVAYNTGPHVLATNGDGNGEAKVNISGGYLIGNKNGTVVFNNAGNILNISGGVITNGTADNGAGIYNNSAKVGVNSDGTYKYGGTGGGTINLTGGVISGNEIIYDWENVNPGDDLTTNRFSGAGIYMKSGTLNISGNAYITNNSKARGESRQNHYSMHGGGGVAADNDSKVKMSGGYVTGNFSNEAGAGLYIGYYENIAGISQFIMTGGTIASNVAQTGEGGGIRIGGGGRGTIAANKKDSSYHPIYITNNTTNTGLNENSNQTGDWGGGGIFVQENGQLSVMNAIITKNTADGFGAGVSACPTGNTSITTDQGAAIYSNEAKGEHYSRGSGTEKEKKYEDAVAYDFYHNNNRTDYQDYFLAHEDGSKGSYRITNAMLGGGSERYSGTFNGNESYEQQYNSRNQSAKFIGLSAGPIQDDIDKALTVASTYISGNHSHNHGGGIMTNGMLNIGESTEVYPALHLTAYKAFLLNASDGKSSKSLSMKNNQFKFAIYQHTGNSSKKPQWDGTEFTGGSGENTLVTEFSNEAADENHLSQLSASIPNYLFKTAGDYTFYFVEEDNGYSYIHYDHTIYSIHFTVESKTIINNNVETTTFAIKDGSLNISKIKSGEEEGLAYKYDKDASKNTSQLTLYSDREAAFTNTQQANDLYDLEITKIEKGKRDRKLQGAAFTLYKIADNYDEVDLPNVTATAIETKITDKNGSAKFSMLKEGEVYYLKETKAPDQHKIAGPWIISIDSDGKAEFYDADCTENTNSDHPNDGDYITLTKNSGKLWKDYVTDLTKENNKESNVFSVTIGDEAIQYTMPNTGGIGTYIYYQAGFLLLTLVNIVWIIKRRVV